MKTTLIFTSICFLCFYGSAQNCYLDDYVEISSVKSDTDTYDVVAMRRSGDRIKAKYFAARDYNGKSVHERYKLWSKSNPNVILISSGTYMNNYSIPVGLTIDNGIVVNQNLKIDVIAFFELEDYVQPYPWSEGCAPLTYQMDHLPYQLLLLQAHMAYVHIAENEPATLLEQDYQYVDYLM